MQDNNEALDVLMEAFRPSSEFENLSVCLLTQTDHRRVIGTFVPRIGWRGHVVFSLLVLERMCHYWMLERMCHYWMLFALFFQGLKQMEDKGA